MLRFSVILFCITAIGCGSSSQSGIITGDVTLNGEPLKSGQVSALNEKNEPVGSAMIIDGKYEIPNVPLGSVTLSVATHTPDGQPITPDGQVKPPPRQGESAPPANAKIKMEGQPDSVDPKSIVPVPLKYMNPKEAGFSLTVVKGTNKYDLVMTGKGEVPHAKLPTEARPGGPGGRPPIPPPPGGFPPGR
jgi:hypothetical protein